MADLSDLLGGPAASAAAGTQLDRDIASSNPNTRRSAAIQGQADALKGEQAASKQAQTDIAAIKPPDVVHVDPWTGHEPEADPLKAFGSTATALAVIASAFTRTPLVNALNAAAVSMRSIRSNQLSAYADAKETWKENVDIALKNSDLEYKGYQAALDRMKTNYDIGMSMWRDTANTYGNMAAGALTEVKDMAEMANAQQRLNMQIDEHRAALEDRARQWDQSIVAAKKANPGYDKMSTEEKNAAIMTERQRIETGVVVERQRASVEQQELASIMAAHPGMTIAQAKAEKTRMDAEASTRGQIDALGGTGKPLTQEQRATLTTQVAEADTTLAEIDSAIEKAKRLGTGVGATYINEPAGRVGAALFGTAPETAELGQDLERLRASLKTRLKGQFEAAGTGLQMGQTTALTLRALETLRDRVSASKQGAAEALGKPTGATATPGAAGTLPPASAGATPAAPAAEPWAAFPIVQPGN